MTVEPGVRHLRIVAAVDMRHEFSTPETIIGRANVKFRTPQAASVAAVSVPLGAVLYPAVVQFLI